MKLLAEELVIMTSKNPLSMQYKDPVYCFPVTMIQSKFVIDKKACENTPRETRDASIGYPVYQLLPA